MLVYSYVGTVQAYLAHSSSEYQESNHGVHLPTSTPSIQLIGKQLSHNHRAARH